MTSPDSGADGRKKKARRGRGEGSVFYDETRKEYAASVSLGYDPETGKRNRPTIRAKSKKEVQQRLADLRSNSASELSRKRAPMLRDFVENWLENEVKPNLRATTYRFYRLIATRYIVTHLGAIRVNLLLATDVARCISKVQEAAGASNASKTRTVLRVVMGRAVALGVAARNPVEGTRAPRVEKDEIEPLTVEQCKALFEAAAGDRFEALPILLALTGLRPGEARALTWADIDFDARDLDGKLKPVIHVTKSVQEAKGALVLVPPKTAKGRRRVAMSPDVVKALRKRHRVARAEGFASAEDTVFPTKTGTLYRGSNLHRRWWAPLLAKAGLEDGVRLYDLRHSAATFGLIAGTPTRVIADMLGHSDAGFTSRTYQHRVESLLHENAAAIDRLFAPKPKPKAKRK